MVNDQLVDSAIAGGLGMFGIVLGIAAGTKLGYAAVAVGVVGAVIAAKTLIELREGVQT